LRGRTWISYPWGTATRKPVGTRANRPGSMIISDSRAARTSAPADPLVSNRGSSRPSAWGSRSTCTQTSLTSHRLTGKLVPIWTVFGHAAQTESVLRGKMPSRLLFRWRNGRRWANLPGQDHSEVGILHRDRPTAINSRGRLFMANPKDPLKPITLRGKPLRPQTAKDPAPPPAED